MSQYAEDQENEIEALTSMFEEGKEFERISGTEYKLKLVPHPTGEEENHVGVTFHVTYTPEYPDSAPDWELEDVKGLPDEKVEELKGKVEESINENLGMVMIYIVCDAIKDYLLENNVKELSMHEQMMQRLKGEGKDGEDEEEDEEAGEDDDDDGPNEEEEWKGLADKPLCPEKDRISADAFAAWKVKFDEEMIAAGVLKRESVKAKSGRQFFLEIKQSEKADGAGGKAGETAGDDKEGVLVYDAALFGEVDEDDLDELSAGED
mmetsp:Transcript_16805/g.42738  ORF Transcript_16805/g.42738 Transcript_16805/m.42738 type:complete len:264 (-) Transcript_16805:14-805(-)